MPEPHNRTYRTQPLNFHFYQIFQLKGNLGIGMRPSNIPRESKEAGAP